MQEIDDTVLFERVLRSRSAHASAEVAWMSAARAIAALTERGGGDIDSAFEVACSLVDDGSTESMLDDLDPVSEEVLGVVPMDDGRKYFVLARERKVRSTDFPVVFLMSTQFTMIAIYRSEFSGIFRKKLRVTALHQSRKTSDFTCSKVDEIRFSDDLDRLVRFLMTAGMLHQLFPDGFVPALAPSYMWLPMRRWIHKL